MRDKEFTTLTLENGYGHKITCESDNSDEPIEDLCQMFYAAMIGITYSPESVLSAMLEFVEEKKGVYYQEVCEDAH